MNLFLRWPKLKVYCFLFSMPVIIIMLHLIMFENRIWADPSIWLLSMPLMFLLGSLWMNSHVMFDYRIEKRLPGLPQTRKRILWKSIVTIFIITPSVLLIFLIYHTFHLFGYTIQPAHLWQAALAALSVNIIFETLYEADFVFRRNRENAAENAALYKLSMGEEFDSLKGQVNPHFLFNCFNTLSSLISTDRERALSFLDELSKVYRRLLKDHSDSLSVLSHEMDFVNSYFKLLETRYGKAVKMRIQVTEEYKRYFIPSMSLQLLVENAVKHNTVSKTNPLVIEIFTSGEDKLVVNNNLQRKLTISHTIGIGLQNIKSKYDLLKQPGFQVMEGNKNFTVVLPLIRKQTDAIQHV